MTEDQQARLFVGLALFVALAAIFIVVYIWGSIAVVILAMVLLVTLGPMRVTTVAGFFYWLFGMDKKKE